MSAGPALSRESRWLRLGSMALMAAALPAFAWFDHGADPLQLLRSGDRFKGLWAALAIVVAVNLFTLGLVLLFGGIFGLHHFYMGHTRRGLWYLAFFWLAFPMVLGWIDAVRLALLDAPQFEARLTSGPIAADGIA